MPCMPRTANCRPDRNPPARNLGVRIEGVAERVVGVPRYRVKALQTGVCLEYSRSFS